jgi:hypothetical protein
MLGRDGRAADMQFSNEFPLPLASGIKIGASEKEVLAAYGAPDSLVQQPQAKEFIYYKDGVILWVMDDQVASFTVLKPRANMPGP